MGEFFLYFDLTLLNFSCLCEVVLGERKNRIMAITSRATVVRDEIRGKGEFAFTPFSKYPFCFETL